MSDLCGRAEVEFVFVYGIMPEFGVSTEMLIVRVHDDAIRKPIDKLPAYQPECSGTELPKILGYPDQSVTIRE